MPPIAFLALLTIAVLALAALRLELDFRRCKEGPAPGPAAPGPGRAPELRASPAGGYWQAPAPPRPFAGVGQARRAGFAF